MRRGNLIDESLLVHATHSCFVFCLMFLSSGPFVLSMDFARLFMFPLYVVSSIGLFGSFYSVHAEWLNQTTNIDSDPFGSQRLALQEYKSRYQTVSDLEDDGEICYIKLFNVGQKAATSSFEFRNWLGWAQGSKNIT